jgi:signal transduction histidine kinase/sensor domain CHASE-containing protein
MSIRKQIIFFLCLASFLLLLFFGAVGQLVFLEKFRDIENNQAKQYALSAQNAYKTYLNNLSMKLIDWSTWDDTYNYVQDKNSDYVKANLQPTSLTQINIDVMIFYDSEGGVVKAMAVNSNTSGEIPVSDSLLSYIRENKNRILIEEADDEASGIILLSGNPFIFSSRPILKSDGSGPVAGTLIFGTYFDERIISYLSNITNLTTKIYTVDDGKLPPDFLLAKKSLMKNSYFVSLLNNSSIAGYFLIEDNSGKSGLIVRVDFSRDVYKQGQQTVTAMLLLVTFFTVVSVAFFYLLLNRFVISRITRLSFDVSNIKNNKSGRLSMGQSVNDDNEINRLTRNINSMIDELSEAKIQESAEREQLETKIKEFTGENAKLENSQKAIINVLEDTKGLEEELKVEKESVEKKIIERTRQLADEQARLQASISSLPIGFAMTDLNNNIVSMNGIAKSVLCVKSGSSFPGAITKESMKHFDCDLNEIRERLKGSFDLKLAIEKVIKERKPFEVKELAVDDLFLHIFITPITIIQEKEFSVIGSVMLVENITEQKILERSKDEFFSIASHELRTPLTAIRGNTSMILDYYGDQLKDPQMKEMVDDVHQSSIRLIEIVNDFLNTSRLELGKIEFKKDVVDLPTLIPLVIKEYQVTSSRQKLYINFEPGEKIPPVIADADRFRQVLINLVGNGMKFTEKGGITISLKADGDFVKILIADTGMGISKNSQNLLFRKFQQAENNIFTRDTTKGTGLGLYVSKMMVEGMGGRIRLEGSEIGKGTTFSFTLPVAK